MILTQGLIRVLENGNVNQIKYKTSNEKIDNTNSEFEVQSLLLIEDKWQCVNLGLEWRNSYLNFDD